jgi:hypothetical protein
LFWLKLSRAGCPGALPHQPPAQVRCIGRHAALRRARSRGRLPVCVRGDDRDEGTLAPAARTARALARTNKLTRTRAPLLLASLNADQPASVHTAHLSRRVPAATESARTRSVRRRACGVCVCDLVLARTCTCARARTGTRAHARAAYHEKSHPSRRVCISQTDTGRAGLGLPSADADGNADASSGRSRFCASEPAVGPRARCKGSQARLYAHARRCTGARLRANCTHGRRRPQRKI